MKKRYCIIVLVILALVSASFILIGMRKQKQIYVNLSEICDKESINIGQYEYLLYLHPDCETCIWLMGQKQIWEAGKCLLVVPNGDFSGNEQFDSILQSAGISEFVYDANYAIFDLLKIVDTPAMYAILDGKVEKVNMPLLNINLLY